MKPCKSQTSSLSLTSVSTSLDFSRSQELFPEVRPSQFASLCSFSKTVKKPSWCVKFPLVLEQTASTARGVKKTKSQVATLRSIREARVMDEGGSRPLSTQRFLSGINPPTPLGKTFLRKKSSELIARLESDCEQLRTRETHSIRLQTCAMKRLRKKLVACEKHTRLISYSNQCAPYYVLLHKFAVKHRKSEGD